MPDGATPIHHTKTVKRDGEYHVKAYDANGVRMPDCDYFTDDKQDAEATARAMCDPKQFLKDLSNAGKE